MKLAPFALLLVFLPISLTFVPTYRFEVIVNNTAPSKLLPPQLGPYNRTQFLFIPTLTNDNLTYTIRTYNVSNYTPVLIASTNFTFLNPLTDCALRQVKNYLLLSFKTALGCEAKVLHVFTLQEFKSFQCEDIILGTYLWDQNLFVYLSTNEKLYYDI